MRYAHEVGGVRAAERALMARLPEGALMARAAAGLASVCARLLPAVYGARVVLLVGGGDNGGDALYAGAALARRGARVTAVRAGRTIHEDGLAALRRAGGRLLPTPTPDTPAPGQGASGRDPAGGGGPDERTPGGSAPGQDGPDERTPGGGTPGGGAPGGGAPGGGAPGGGAPGGSGPGQGASGGEPAGAGGPHGRASSEGVTGLGATGGVGRVAGGVGVEAAAAIGAADLIIDGLTGIGGSGGLREPHAALAALAGAAAGTVVACDVPSGVDASTGRVAGAAVRADVTVTFGTYKPGLLVDPGASHCGVLELVDIGLGPHLPDPDVAAPWPEDVRPPEPGPESDKYRRGVVGVLAGGDAYTGAAVLCAGGAVRGGAGMVRFASSAHPVELVRHRWPEAVTTVIDPARLTVGDEPARGAAERILGEIGRVQAWVAGPGLGTGAAAEALLAAVLGTDVPVLVDADGLTVLARRRDLLARAAPTVLTPHAGELSRLIGADRADIEAGRLEHVRRAAAELPATVLLKGSTTLVAEAGRPVRVNPTGTPRLATAGTGDVLSGLIGALLAGGLPALDAAAAGAYLHGLAARLAADGAPISASTVLEGLPAAFRALS